MKLNGSSFLWPTKTIDQIKIKRQFLFKELFSSLVLTGIVFVYCLCVAARLDDMEIDEHNFFAWPLIFTCEKKCNGLASMHTRTV